MSFTFAFDAIAADYGYLPAGYQVAGYDTGGPGYAWTQAMWAAHPGAVHVDQATDTVVLEAIAADEFMFSVAGHVTSDVLDVESGAVAVGSPLIPVWVRAAQASWNAASRPGQRTPALYCSADNVTANVNALIAGGVTGGVGLWIASWGIGTAAAVAELLASAGPFPVIGIQFSGGADIDSDVFSADWLANVSGQVQGPWTFGELTGFKLAGYGPHSLEVVFSAPQVFVGTPPDPAPGIPCYEIAVSEGLGLRADIPGYPRYLPKGANPQTWASGGLTPGTQYTVAVRAYLEGHSGPWSTAVFTTPES
jgi:hypothetical protein